MSAVFARLTLGIVTVLAAGGAALAQDQDPAVAFIGRTVSSVRVEIEDRPVSVPDLLALVDVQANQPLERTAIRRSVDRLSTLGQFRDVEVRASDDGAAGVAIVFHLVPRHPIDRLEFTGDTGVPPGELGSLVRARYGGLPTTERLDELETAVERLLADAGYLGADVRARTVDTHDPDRATLVLDVQAGVQARVGGVVVTGTSPLSATTVLARAGVAVGGPYRPRDLQVKLAALGDGLRADGYYEAVTSLSATPPVDNRVDVTIFVSAGPKVDLRFAGDPLPPGEPRDLVPIERYRSADADLLADSRLRIRAGLARIGYRDAAVAFDRVAADGGARLVITFTIQRGRRYRIDRIAFAPDLEMPAESLQEALAVRPGDPFSEVELTAGATRVVREYQRLGYYRVSAAPDYQVLDTTNKDGEPLVAVFPNINEGPRGTLSTIVFDIEGGGRVDEAVLREAMTSKPGGPYVPATVAQDQRRLEAVYRDRGFRSAATVLVPSFGDDGRDVTLTVRVSEGPLIVVGDIVVVGNQNISAQAVLDVITLRSGAPFGASAEIESRTRLIELGIFRQVRIVAPPLLPGETRANLVISVEESPANTLGFGGGLEVGRRARASGADELEVAPRGFFEIGRRNLGGRNRSVNLFTRVALKPRTTDDGTGTRAGTGYGFSEYRATGTLREQHAFHTDADLLLSLTSEQAIRTSFNFVRRAANAELLRRLSPNVNISGRYALDFTQLFDEIIPPDEQPLIDRLFPQVRLSILSSGILWDRRDNALAPTRGTLMSADVEVALRRIGSQVGYAKTFVQASGFRRLGTTARTVLAGRAQIGLARGFERVAPIRGPDGEPSIGVDGLPLTEVVADLPASQRFFAGGGTTVRGFQLDRLGVPEILNANGLSNGGNAVVVLNAELRTIVGQLFGRNFGVVGFVDGGNVFARAGNLDLTRLRAATGFGIRYESPLGPLRLDFGFKTNRRFIGGNRERGWEYHLSIGEVF